MNWYYIIIGASAFQGILLVLALQKVKNNKPSIAWLSAILLAISVCLVGRIFYDPTLFPRFPKIAIASDLMMFNYGPFVFWYVRSIFYRKSERPRGIKRHFVIACIHFFWILQYLIVADKEIFRMLSLPLHQTAGKITEILSWLHITSYLLASYQEFIKYPESAKGFVSNLPTTKFLQFFFSVNFVALMMWFTGFFLLKLHGSSMYAAFTYNSIWMLLTASVYITGYFAIAFPQVFRIQIEKVAIQGEGILETHQPFFVQQKESTIEKNIATIINETETERTESVSIEIKESIKETTLIVSEKPAFNKIQVLDFTKRLESFMELQKPYLDPNLTLPMLAGKLSCSVHLLSKVINESFEKNFFDYVNSYRVNYFIKLVKKEDNKQYTILSLAFESGFNSKSTFNNSFKKVTGKTPSDFIKSIIRDEDKSQETGMDL